jgi:enoyl-CoA hydratase/carnithine racemase
MTTPAYFDAFDGVAMQRDAAGVLEFRLHTRGGSFLFSSAARRTLIDALHAVAQDRDNRVMILTGTGDDWCADFDRAPPSVAVADPGMNARWDRQFWEGRKLLQNLLDVEVPTIAAVNGPARIHSEYLLTCDIVLASERAVFQDRPHLDNGVPPTDGVHVLWPHVLGPGRGRYFLLTQQELSAHEALALGVCQEVLPHEGLMARARELAARLAQQPTQSLRAARVGLTQRLKRLVTDDLALGLAVESIAAYARALDGR